MKDTNETVCQCNSCDAAQQKFVKLCSYNLKDIMCRCAYLQEIFSQSNALFEVRKLAKMKDTTKTVCQRNSSETAQQNFLKLCSNKGYAYPQEILIQFFLSEFRPF